MKKYLSVFSILFFVLVLNFHLAVPTFAQPDPTIQLDKEYHTPRFIKEKWTNTKITDKQALVWSYLEAKKTLFKFNNDPKEHFQIKKQESDQLGQTHYRMQQVYQGIPVYGADQTIHLENNQQINSYFGTFIPDLAKKKLPTKAKISKQTAIQTMQKDIKLTDSTSKPKIQLWIYPHQNQFHLAYEIKLSTVQPQPGYWHYYIDATNGKIIHKFNAIQHVQGNGKGVFGENKTFEVTCQNNDSSCTLHDQTRGKGIKTHDAQNKDSKDALPGPLVSSDSTTFNEPAGVDAHAYLSKTYDYFKQQFGRNSFDNQGATIISSVHVGSKWNNAAWNGEQILFGDGDGELFTTLSAALDVTAHELTHALTEHTAGLRYYNESGALNESFSDIFGVMVDPDDWLIGEDIYTPNKQGDALRSMQEPTKYNQPDHYQDRYIGFEDNGGVHINSGINNKAAYLLMDGGTFKDVTVQKIGKEKTSKIYYRALTLYLTTSSNFSDMRQAATQSAQDLFGENAAEVTAVKKAYDAVGVK